MKKLCYVISQGRDANGLAIKFKKYLDILEHRSRFSRFIRSKFSFFFMGDFDLCAFCR